MRDPGNELELFMISTKLHVFCLTRSPSTTGNLSLRHQKEYFVARRRKGFRVVQLAKKECFVVRIVNLPFSFVKTRCNFDQ